MLAELVTALVAVHAVALVVAHIVALAVAYVAAPVIEVSMATAHFLLLPSSRIVVGVHLFVRHDPLRLHPYWLSHLHYLV